MTPLLSPWIPTCDASDQSVFEIKKLLEMKGIELLVWTPDLRHFDLDI